MDVRDPFGFRRDFDAALNRIEAAIGDPMAYGPLENAADIEITKKFDEYVWPTLTHAEQQHYASRLAYLKSKGRGQTT